MMEEGRINVSEDNSPLHDELTTKKRGESLSLRWGVALGYRGHLTTGIVNPVVETQTPTIRLLTH